jgi:GTP-binding protein Era
MNSGIVSIIGRPNVGKSTLINRFVGEKIAAVSPKPQTTRNRIMGVHTTARGQIVFMDTPGIHKPFNKMHQKMVEIALASLQGMDLILLVIDASQEFGAGDQFVIEQVKTAHTPIILAINKIDLIKKPLLLPLMERYRLLVEPTALVPVSAIKGDGIAALEDELLSHLPEQPALYPEDTLTDQPERALVAEIIREKVFINAEREVPFCTAVVIDGFEERETMISIAASIIVERNSQKAIVIGRGAQMLKKIGTEARRELEQILATKIYLDLHVKVREGWREDDRMLRDLGLS